MKREVLKEIRICFGELKVIGREGWNFICYNFIIFTIMVALHSNKLGTIKLIEYHKT